MNKRPEVVARTRKNLKDAFWELFRSRKMEQITIKEITSLAGCNRSTFYEYFRDTYDVLDSIEAELIARVAAEVLEGHRGGMTREALERLVALYREEGELLGTLLGEKGDPRFSGKLKAVMFAPVIRSMGLSEDDPYARFYFEFGISSIIGAVSQWYGSGFAIPASEVVGLISSMLASGVFSAVERRAKEMGPRERGGAASSRS